MADPAAVRVGVALLLLLRSGTGLAQTTAKPAPVNPASYLQIAENRAVLDRPGTAPFHLVATIDTTSDTGIHSIATIVEDWYNDRWSRQTVTMAGFRSERLNVDGKIYTAADGPAFPFNVRRLLTALSEPFQDVDRRHLPDAAKPVQLGSQTLQCLLLPKQPSGYHGVAQQERSFCFSGEGDLRIANQPFGFRVVYNPILPVANRYVSGNLQLFHNGVPVGSLHVTELRPAPELSPKSFALEGEEQRRLDSAPVRTLLLMTAEQTYFQVRSIDAHMVPMIPAQIHTGQRFAILHVLVGADGKLQDAEVLRESDATVGRQALKVAKTMLFHRQTGDNIQMFEGMLALVAL